MKKTNLKNAALFGSGLLAIGIPVALAASCGTSEAPQDNTVVPAIAVEASASELAKITFSGNTSVFNYTIPKELIYVDTKTNKLSATGTRQVFDVYARTTQNLGQTAATSNNSFMPLELLKYYMAGYLEYDVNNNLVANVPDTTTAGGVKVVNINSQFKGLFGFNTSNYKPTLLGEWKKDILELRYYPLEGYTATVKAELTKVVKPATTSLRTFVNLSTAWYQPAQLATNFAWDATSTHDNVKWTKFFKADGAAVVNGVNNLPDDWKSFVDKVQYSTSTTAATTNLTDAPATSYPYSAAARKLYLNLIPKNVDQILPVTTIDISLATKLNDVITNVDAFANYSAIDFSKVQVTEGSQTFIVDDSGVARPDGAEIRYKVTAPNSLVTSSNIGSYVTKNTLIATLQSIKTGAVVSGSEWYSGLVVAAKFVVTDATKFVITDSREANVTFKLANAIATDAFFTEAAKIKVTGTSTSSNIQYTGVLSATSTSIPATIRDNIDRVEYLLGNYPTVASAQAATTWAATPASSTSETTNFLWVRLIAKAGARLDRTIGDLTTSANLSVIASNIDTSSLQTIAQALKAGSDSVHNLVSWENPISIPAALATSVTEVKYLSGSAYSTLALAQAAPDTAWVNTIPTSFEYVHNSRNLFVKFVAASGVTLTQPIIDVTTTSGLRSVKSDISATANFNTIDLQKVAISGLQTTATVDTSQVTLPTGTQLTYTFGDDTSWVVWSSFTTKLAAATTKQSLESIKLRLEVTDTTLYTLTDHLETRPNITNLTFSASYTVPATLIDSLALIKVQAGSTDTNITWSAAPTLPQQVASLSYLYGNYPTQASAQAATEWSASLPTAVSTFTTERFLWVRLNAPEGYALSQTYLDITTSSQIRTILQNVTTRANSLASEVINSFNTRGIKFSAASTHDNVTWTLPTLTTDELKYVSLSYLSSTTSLTNTQLAQATTWSSTLPTSVSFDFASRFIYVRVSPTSETTITNGAVYSQYAAASDIPARVDAHPSYAAINLTQVVIGGSLAAPQINESIVVLTPNTIITYAIGGSSNYLNKDDFIRYITDNRTTITSTQINGIQARLELITKPKYILINDKQAHPTTTISLKATVDIAVPTDLTTFINDLKVQSGSLTTQINWPSLPAMPANVLRLEFLTGATYNSLAAAQNASDAAWRVSLPTTTLEEAAQRYLYARIIPSDGYSFTTSTLVDISASSEIRTLNTDVTSQLSSLTSAINLIAPSATSNHTNITWDNTALPANITSYFTVRYLADNTVTDLASLKTKLANLSATLPTTVLYNHASDRLWAYATPKAGYIFTNNELALDLSAKLQSVRSLVDNNPNFAAVNLTQVLMTLKISSLSIDETAVTLPADTRIVYRLQGSQFAGDPLQNPDLTGSVWLPRSEFITFLSNSGVPILDQNTINSVRAKLDVTDQTRFTITNTKEATPNITAVQPVVTEAAPAGVVTAINAIRVDLATSRYNNVVWNLGTLESSTLPTNVDRIEYLSNENYDTLYKAQTAADSEWSTTIPTSFSINPEKRFLYVRIKAATNFIFTNPIHLITISSQLNLVTERISYADFTAALNYVKANFSTSASSAHNNVVWNYPTFIAATPQEVVPTSTALFDYEYLLTDDVAAPSLTDVTGVASLPGWTKTLPLSVNYEAAKRRLFIRLIAKPGYLVTNSVASPATFSTYVENMSALAGNIVSNVDAHPLFNAIDLGTITITGSFANAIINESGVVLPAGAQIKYRIATSSWMSRADFITYLSNNVVSLQAADFTTLKARLEVQSAAYTINNDKETNPDARYLSRTSQTSPTASVVANLNSIRVTSTSSYTAVTYTNAAPALSGNVARIEYLSGNYATQAAAEAAANSEWSVSLPTSVDGTIANRFLWARLIPTSGFTFDVAYYDLTSTSGILSIPAAVTEAQKTSVASEINNATPTTASRSEAVAWENTTISSELLTIFNINYLNGNYATEADAKAASTGWSSTLPASVEYDNANRHLWVRVAPNPSYSFDTFYIDLTAKSRQVISTIDTHPKYAAIDLTKIDLEFSSRTSKPVINKAGVDLPVGVEYEYSFAKDVNNADIWLSESNYLAAAEQAANLSSTNTNTKVRLVSADTTKYELLSAKTGVARNVLKYDTEWTYELRLVDTEASYNSVSRLNMYDASGAVFVLSNFTFISTDLLAPTISTTKKTVNFIAVSGVQQLGDLPSGSVLKFRTNKEVASFSSTIRFANNFGADISVTAPGTYLTVAGNYNTALVTKRLSFVRYEGTTNNIAVFKFV